MTRLIGALLLVLMASGCGSEPTPTPPPTTWLQFVDQNAFWLFMLAAFLIFAIADRGKS